MHSNLGEELRKKRKQFGITQAMLADEVGVSRKYICDFENGKVSDNPHLAKAIFDTLERFNPDTPLELVIDYCRIRFPTKDVKYVIEHLLQLKIKYFGVEDYSFYGYKQDKKLLMGKTLYIGSLKSDIYFCIYEKDYEQFLKNVAQNRIDGLSIEDMEVKNRFEIRLKNDRAYHAADDLVSNEAPEETAFGIINRYLCFLDSDETKPREDWRINRSWDYFIGERRGKLKLTTKPKPFSLERTMGWVNRQVAPSLKTILELDKIKGTNNLGGIIDNAKLQDKHHKLIMQQSVPIEEIIISPTPQTK